MTIDVRPLTGSDLDQVLPDVARLRMSVFREWPYLYDGSFDYEHRYLQSYRDSEGAIIVGAFEGEQLVGAATGTPMADHADDFAAAWTHTHHDLSDMFYCAESVLLPDYRGRGVGHAFFDARETHARRLGFVASAFCAVVRPEDHPRRPKQPRRHDAFWRKRGYEPVNGVLATFSWKDVGEKGESRKSLQFWMRAL